MRPFPSRNNRALVCKAECGRKSESNSLPIPKGLRPEAQGCEERATLGQRIRKTKKPQRGFGFGERCTARVATPLRSFFFRATYLPKVARSSRPGALLRNPVGILGKHALPKPDLRTYPRLVKLPGFDGPRVPVA